MDINLFCIWCGGRLAIENGQAVCLGCDAEYSNILLSESREEDWEKVAMEMSVSIDCLLVKPKLKPPVLEMQECAVEVAPICDS
jgi:hypothetical protein